jgi:hypothetical protein
MEHGARAVSLIVVHRKIKNFGMPENKTEIISFGNSAETNDFSIPENCEG